MAVRLDGLLQGSLLAVFPCSLLTAIPRSLLAVMTASLLSAIRDLLPIATQDHHIEYLDLNHQLMSTTMSYHNSMCLLMYPAPLPPLRLPASPALLPLLSSSLRLPVSPVLRLLLPPSLRLLVSPALLPPSRLPIYQLLNNHEQGRHAHCSDLPDDLLSSEVKAVEAEHWLYF